MHPSSRRRVATCLYLASTLAAYAAASGSAQNGPAKDDYYPLRKGNEWHRRDRLVGGGGDEYRVEVADVEVENGTTRARVLLRHSPTIVGKARLLADGGGVYDGNTSYGKTRLIKYPLKVGEAWAESFPAGADGRPAVEITRRVAGREEVEVPAGKFTAVEVHSVRTTDGHRFTDRAWYANGVGEVKAVRVVEYPGGKQQTVVTELLRFTPGK
ncbi:MAG: hypothetical protein U0804_12015 [Gemmataceae bacterium]